jgi:hypothetical protein
MRRLHQLPPSLRVAGPPAVTAFTDFTDSDTGTILGRRATWFMDDKWLPPQGNTLGRWRDAPGGPQREMIYADGRRGLYVDPARPWRGVYYDSGEPDLPNVTTNDLSGYGPLPAPPLDPWDWSKGTLMTAPEGTEMPSIPWPPPVASPQAAQVKVQGVPVPTPANNTAPTSSSPSLGAAVWSVVGVVSGALAAYHGGVRNHGSLWQTVKWGVLGGLFPVPVLPYAAVQGFAKPRTDMPADKPAEGPATAPVDLFPTPLPTP